MRLRLFHRLLSVITGCHLKVNWRILRLFYTFIPDNRILGLPDSETDEIHLLGFNTTLDFGYYALGIQVNYHNLPSQRECPRCTAPSTTNPHNFCTYYRRRVAFVNLMYGHERFEQAANHAENVDYSTICRIYHIAHLSSTTISLGSKE